MANSNDALLATRLQNIRVSNEELYKLESMRKLYGALNFYSAQTSMAGGVVTPELRNIALHSTGRTIQMPVLKRVTATQGTSRSCSIPNNEAKSDMVGVTFVTRTDGFKVFPSRYNTNEIGLEAHVDFELRQMIGRFMESVDALCLANLEAKKNTYWTGYNTLGYPTTGNVITGSSSSRMEVMGDISSIINGLGFSGRMNVVGDIGTSNIFKKLHEHETYNDVDRGLEYMDKTLYTDTKISVDYANNYGECYIVPDGMLGFVSRVSRDEAAGSQANEHKWGTEFLPGLEGLTFGTHQKVITGNMAAQMNGEGTFTDTESSVNDLDCSYGIEYGFTLEIAFVNAYASTASAPYPIVKAAVTIA